VVLQAASQLPTVLFGLFVLQVQFNLIHLPLMKQLLSASLASSGALASRCSGVNACVPAVHPRGRGHCPL